MRLTEPAKHILYAVIGSTLSAIMVWVVIEKILKPTDKAIG